MEPSCGPDAQVVKGACTPGLWGFPPGPRSSAPRPPGAPAAPLSLSSLWLCRWSGRVGLVPPFTGTPSVSPSAGPGPAGLTASHHRFGVLKGQVFTAAGSGTGAEGWGSGSSRPLCARLTSAKAPGSRTCCQTPSSASRPGDRKLGSKVTSCFKIVITRMLPAAAVGAPDARLCFSVLFV